MDGSLFSIDDWFYKRVKCLYVMICEEVENMKQKNVWDMTIDDKINTIENRFYVYPWPITLFCI